MENASNKDSGFLSVAISSLQDPEIPCINHISACRFILFNPITTVQHVFPLVGGVRLTGDSSTGWNTVQV